MAAVLRAGDVFDCPVHGDQDSVFFYREAEEIGIGDLLMAEEPAVEGRGKVGPAGGDGPEAVAGKAGEFCQYQG